MLCDSQIQRILYFIITHHATLMFQLPSVSIALSQHPALIYSPKSIVGAVSARNPSPPQSSPTSTTTPTTPHPTTPFQPTPTRPTPKKIYTCKLCGKTFNNSGNFSRHQKVHTGSRILIISRICSLQKKILSMK